MTDRYGQKAEPIRQFDLGDWFEVMHYMYLPVKMPGTDVRIPERLKFVIPVINRILADIDTQHRYIYVTARRGFATPDNPLNRPGWHCDGFGTNDMNYVWYDRWPTRIAVQHFHEVSTDHTESMRQFEKALMDPECIVRMPDRWLLKFNPFVVHTTPVIPAGGGFRSFLKVSVSDYPYNLEGNSHNYLFDYWWQMYPREHIRNDPSYGQGDYFIPPMS